VILPARHGFLLFLGLSLILILPALLLPSPFAGDGPVHIRWQVAFAREFWSGHPFPRWLPEMNRGFGSPAFFYYPPALQALAALFGPLLPGDGQAARRLAVALGLLSLAGAQGCRLWLRSLGGSEAAAVLAGALWLVMPYRAFVDVYQRCALAECAGLCVLPWLGVAAVRLADGQRGGWALHALAIALLAYTHMPGTVIGYGFAAAHGLALLCAEAERRRRLRLLLALGSSALAGLAVAAAMLVPALSLLHLMVDPTALIGERNQPHNWLLFSGRPWVDHVARQAALGVLAMTLMMAAALGRAAVSLPLARARCVGWAMIVTIVAASLLNLGLSRPIWDMHTPLSRIQFPFRLLGASSLAACLLAGLAYDRFGDARQAWRIRLLWLLLAGIFAGDMAALAYQRLRPRDARPPALAEILASNDDSSEYILGDLPAAAARFGPHLAVTPGDAPVSPTVRSAIIGNRHIRVEYQAQKDGALALRQFAFTGWHCRIDGGPWAAAGTVPLGAPLRPARVPLCAVPAGPHRLEARLPASPAEQWGHRLALAGLSLILLSLAGGQGRRFRMPLP
jgi:hypothetical protein